MAEKSSGYLTSMPGNLPDYEAFYGKAPSMKSQPFHCHDYFEIYIHVKGGHCFGMDNDVYRLEPGQLFLIPPYSMHGLIAEGEMIDYERGYLNLSSEKIDRYGCGQFDVDRFFHSYTGKGRYLFALSTDEVNGFVEDLKYLQQHQSDMEELNRFRCCARLVGLLSRVCGIIGEAEGMPASTVTGSVIRDVLSYINEHYTTPLTVDSLARHFGISGSYLSHEFGSYTGRSVYDYILYRRVMLAKEMIRGDMTLNEIAYACGFNEYSNFLRMFKRTVGMSPGRYRAQLKRN